jgi:magnesium chelatase accessory protein
MAINNQDASPVVIGINAALEPFGGSLAYLFSPLARVVSMTPLLPALVSRRARNADVVRRMLDSTGSRLDDLGVHWYQQLLTREQHVRATIRMMADWDLHSLVQDMAIVADRCHLLVGDRDLAVPPEQARRLKRRHPGIQLTHMDTLGHLAHEEDPELVASYVREIMRGIC